MVFSVRGSAGHVYRIVSTQGVMRLLTVTVPNFHFAMKVLMLTVKSSVPESQSPRPRPTFSHSPDGLL